MLKKSILLTGLMTGMTALWLCGCSQEIKENDTLLGNGTVISVNKDGRITSTMVESFAEPYYQQDELQDMILTEAAAYNAEQGEDCIGVEKVLVENGMVTVIMNFAEAECYADYKDTVLFVGTIAEAEEKGFDLNITCHDIEGTDKVIGREQILEMEKSYILITDEPVGVPSVLDDEIEFQPISVETFGKILYVSDGIVIGKNKNFARIETEAEGLSYIIFK